MPDSVIINAHTRVHDSDARRLDQALEYNHTIVGSLLAHHPGCDYAKVGPGKGTPVYWVLKGNAVGGPDAPQEDQKQ